MFSFCLLLSTKTWNLVLRKTLLLQPTADEHISCVTYMKGQYLHVFKQQFIQILMNLGHEFRVPDLQKCSYIDFFPDCRWTQQICSSEWAVVISVGCLNSEQLLAGPVMYESYCVCRVLQWTSVECVSERGRLCVSPELQHKSVRFLQTRTISTASKQTDLCTVWYLHPAVSSWQGVQKAVLQYFSSWHRWFSCRCAG